MPVVVRPLAFFFAYPISMTFRLILCLLVLSLPTTLHATGSHTDTQQAANYQPFETRDQNPFNLIHGQALPTNARLNTKQQSRWSTNLVITNTINSESNNAESIYLDYESYRLNLSYQYGLNENWNLKLDVPLIYQSGGMFDSAIDKWHQFWGMPRGQRPSIENNQYDIRYDYQSQSLFDLDEASTTLGDIQLALARSLLDDPTTRISLWTSIKLPTGDKNKLTGSGATDFSAWLAMNQQLSTDWLLNLNAGAVILGSNSYQDIPLSDSALYGHIMLGWLMTDTINLKVQLQGHTSYYEKSRLKMLGDTYFLTFGGSIKINSCNQLDIAMSEDIKVNSSPDISLLINWRSYTSQC